MKTKKQKKSGFTLVELMVVAIIVAILAAVAIPLMTGNKDRAMATEAQAGCSTIATQLRMYWAEHGSAATAGLGTTLTGIKAGDMNGTYFSDAGYSFTQTAADAYVVTATGNGGDAGTDTVVMTVTAGKTVWTGTLLD